MPEYSSVQKDHAQYRLERAKEDLDENAIRFITSEIVNKVLDLLKKDVYKIILYGSYARGGSFIWMSIWNAKYTEIFTGCGKKF